MILGWIVLSSLFPTISTLVITSSAYWGSFDAPGETLSIDYTANDSVSIRIQGMDSRVYCTYPPRNSGSERCTLPNVPIELWLYPDSPPVDIDLKVQILIFNVVEDDSSSSNADVFGIVAVSLLSVVVVVGLGSCLFLLVFGILACVEINACFLGVCLTSLRYKSIPKRKKADDLEARKSDNPENNTKNVANSDVKDDLASVPKHQDQAQSIGSIHLSGFNSQNSGAVTFGHPGYSLNQQHPENDYMPPVDQVQDRMEDRMEDSVEDFDPSSGELSYGFGDFDQSESSPLPVIN